MWVFSEALKDVVLREIVEQLRVDHAGRVSLGEHLYATPASREDQSVLSGILKLGVLTPNELGLAVHNRLCVYGRLMYAQVVKGEYPDHVSSPKALAYALRHDETTQRLVKGRGGIALDHDETLESFEARADGLLEKVVEQLFAGPPAESEWPVLSGKCAYYD
ncbi:MAG: hypothetical protein WBO92_05070 [Candidatus Moraniibacteriota bacterium]